MQRDRRLKKKQDFDYTRARGRRVSDRLLVLGAARVDPDSPTRFGLAVGKRVGRAVIRNKVKRRLRECLRRLDVKPGYNIVVSARPAAAFADYHELQASVEGLADRAGVLRTRSSGADRSDERRGGRRRPRGRNDTATEGENAR